MPYTTICPMPSSGRILAIEQFFNDIFYEKKAITRIAFFSLMIIFLNQVS